VGTSPNAVPLQDLSRRDSEMLRRYEAGETLARIGASLGLSRERVRQVVKRSGAEMPRSRKCAAAGCDKLPDWPRSYCHNHQDRFELYGDPLGTGPAATLLVREHGTHASYRQGGCRCDVCRKASAEKRREQFHRQHPEWRYMPAKAPKSCEQQTRGEVQRET
jgi:hypothetical protein